MARRQAITDTQVIPAVSDGAADAAVRAIPALTSRACVEEGHLAAGPLLSGPGRLGQA